MSAPKRNGASAPAERAAGLCCDRGASRAGRRHPAYAEAQHRLCAHCGRRAHQGRSGDARALLLRDHRRHLQPCERFSAARGHGAARVVKMVVRPIAKLSNILLQASARSSSSTTTLVNPVSPPSRTRPGSGLDPAAAPTRRRRDRQHLLRRRTQGFGRVEHPDQRHLPRHHRHRDDGPLHRRNPPKNGTGSSPRTDRPHGQGRGDRRDRRLAVLTRRFVRHRTSLGR